MPDRAGLAAIALTVALTVAGQLLVKLGATEAGPGAGLLGSLLNPRVAGGLGCAMAAALCWIAALSRSTLSFAYPFMALAIVLVLALSPLVLGESVPSTRWLGVAIVCVGILVASRA